MTDTMPQEMLNVAHVRTVVDGLTGALERYEERYARAVLSARDWAQANPEAGLDIAVTMLKGVRDGLPDERAHTLLSEILNRLETTGLLGA